MEKVLFISVDGEQIYLKSLFLPILSPLNKDNIKIEILQFCLNNQSLKDDLKKECLKENIDIHFGKYFNKPKVIGSFLFILVGAIKLFFTIKKTKSTILMPRSLVAGAMVLLINPFFKDIKIVFETDGLMADERVDFAGWSKEGLIYKLFRKIEKKLIESSSKITTRTKKAKNILSSRSNQKFDNKIDVIPNGKQILNLDLEEKNKIRNKTRNKLNFKEDDLVLIYVGSIGEQYKPKIMLDIFKYIKSKNISTKLIILTPNLNEIKNTLDDYKDLKNSIYINKVSSTDVINYTLASDIGLTLRSPSFSQQGICPLKLIDYLQVGLPVIANKGIGDLDELFEKNEIGYIIDDLDNLNYEEIYEFSNSIKNFKPLTLNNIAKKEFDLNSTINSYQALYKEVINEK